ncbi:hypothetical protein LR48_Vigan04g119600 [Vigna angularis]|uniref:Uncharacterized protein n=1 Tax=Phaseolus angularis TaxID=3914 RepID=A0A0L9UE42_PHAAN|nr:hypothetical protein LR48_Vigan04g119600 [Vigna angularis]
MGARHVASPLSHPIRVSDWGNCSAPRLRFCRVFGFAGGGPIVEREGSRRWRVDGCHGGWAMARTRENWISVVFLSAGGCCGLAIDEGESVIAAAGDATVIWKPRGGADGEEVLADDLAVAAFVGEGGCGGLKVDSKVDFEKGEDERRSRRGGDGGTAVAVR